MKSTRLLTKTNSSAKWMARVSGAATLKAPRRQQLLPPRPSTRFEENGNRRATCVRCTSGGRNLIALVCPVPPTHVSRIQFLGDRTSTYIVEESVLDPRAKTLTTFTKNITLNNLMTIEEKCIYSVSEENPNWTTCQTQAKVTSGLLIGNMVEKFGIDRFQNNSAKAKQSIVYVLGKMKEKSATGLAKVAKVAKIAKTAKTATCAGEAA